MSVCGSQVLLAGAPCRASFMHLELTWSSQEQERGDVARRRRWNWLTKGEMSPVPKKKRCSSSGMQMKGPQVVLHE